MSAARVFVVFPFLVYQSTCMRVVVCVVFEQCFCGNNEEPYTYGEIDEEECDFTCPGGSAAPDENCGGGWALSVYSAYPSQL